MAPATRTSQTRSATSPGAGRALLTRAAAVVTGLAVALAGAVVATGSPAQADERTATLVGDLQSELGCPGDWQPACEATVLEPVGDGLYAAEFTLPGGQWEYKIAMNGTWDEAYGRDGGDANVPLVLGGDARVQVVYDDTSRRISLVPLDLAAGYGPDDDAVVAPPVRQPGSGEQFYFVMTDRFANADPSNDTGGIDGGPLDHGFDPTDKGFYHGGDLAGLLANLDYIEGLGTTAIWLTPSFLNRAVQGSGDDISAGYHGYWITDFTRIDPHLGTNAELEALIDAAHARGMKVYFDIITNHTADVIDYAEGQYSYVPMAEVPYRDSGGTPFDPGDYAGTDTFPDLDAETSFPYTPVIPPEDADLKVPAWLNDPTLYHNRGNSTWTGESVTFGDFDGLDDLMTEHPTVVQGFIDVYQTWIDLGIDGFRIDTVKHVNWEFWETWTTEVLDYAHASDKPDFFMFGEVYDADAGLLAPYVRGTDMNSVLDFAYQASAANYVRGFSPDTLSALFASDDLYTTPETSASALPTFLGNHDMGRIGHVVKEADDPLARTLLAHTLMFTTRGQPVIYYGDEQGFIGDGSLGGRDKDARQTLFATQVDEYANQQLVTGETAGSVDRFDTDAPVYAHVAELAELRVQHPALVSGAQLERPDTGPGAGSVYAFSRVDRDERVEHLVALNNAGSTASVEVTSLTPGGTFTDVLGDHAPVTAGADGVVSLTVPAHGAVVLVADATVGADADPAITVETPAPGAALDGLAPVAADVPDTWRETSFAYRLVGADTWTPLGTAETTAPRVFHDVADLPDGALVEYRAVTVDAGDARAAASTYGSVRVAVDGALPPDDPGGSDLFVTIPGSHGPAFGCPQWAPDCEAGQLTWQGGTIYAGTFTVPAGSYEYKVAIGGSWDENYGAGGEFGGSNVTYSLDAEAQVTFVYDHRTHGFTSSAQGALMTLPGSYQSSVGCDGDWQPDCLATVLIDADGDGTATFIADAIPGGTFEVKVAHGLSWAENYGAGGQRDGANIPFVSPGGKPILFSYDIASHVLTIEVTDPPLPGIGLYQAHWIDQHTIAWSPALLPDGLDPAGLTWQLHHAPDGSLEVTDGAVVGGDAADLELVPGGLTQDQRDRFPALADHVALHLTADRAEVATWLTGELTIAQYDGDDLTAATGPQIPGVLDDLYAADASDHAYGATWQGNRPTLRVWAPTATNVDLLLWAGGDTDAEPQRVAMQARDDGSWSVRGHPQWRQAAYRYEVTVYAPTTDAIEVNEVTDPASVALTLNSTHSVLVNLRDRALRPAQWERTAQPVVEPVDQTIYELHVRDFSVSDATVPEELRGTYLAFTQDGTAGREHLRGLADAGLTTVHLLPTFDITTIEEDRSAQLEPPCDLASFPPDSPEQQACIDEIRDEDGFNWGYDPYHWSTPEGSYAVDAHGGARVAEFREMVGALHADGLQVVLDKVYNHTSSSGQAATSVLDRVVPGYYHRLNAIGQVETSTCCQNIATEHVMAEKMMVDSVVLWAREYKVDGFRFDLMGHHSVANMLAVRAALDALTPARDGVDGSAVYLYGEGWNFGEVADNALFTQATQGQLDGTGIGTFSDRLRDAVRGGGPFDADPRIQGFGSGLYTDPNGATVNGSPEQQEARLAHQSDLVRLGLAGNLREYAFLTSAGVVQTGAQLDYNGSPAGYATSPEEIITYVDAHDNETLWDALTLKLAPDTPMADRVRMNTVSLATTALAQTPSFWHAGADLLRSKSLDRNSYNSGDWFNVLDWSMQTNGFGRGLPPAADNAARWEYHQPLLADPALVPAPEDIATASAAAQDLLRLRFSTDLFRLGDADLIGQKVTFPGSGPDADPGVIVMHVDDTVGPDVDRDLDGVLAVFNATPDAVTITLDELAGAEYALSPVQEGGADDVVRGTTWDVATGTVTVPARTVAVLVDEAADGGGWPWPWHGGQWWNPWSWTWQWPSWTWPWQGGQWWNPWSWTWRW